MTVVMNLSANKVALIVIVREDAIMAKVLSDLLAALCVQEFVTGLSVLARGTVQEKLLWAYSLYDTDGDGVVTHADLLDVVSAIYDLMGKYAEPVITPDTAREHVDKVFQVCNPSTSAASSDY